MAVFELVNTIFECFEKNDYAVGVFIDLMRAFDNVNMSPYWQTLYLLWYL